MVPFAPGLSQHAVAYAQALAAPPKHVTFVENGRAETLTTKAGTVADLLTERGIVRAPEDAVQPAPDAALIEGGTVDYRAALPVALSVDGAPAQTVRSLAPTVGALLTANGIAFDRHDRVVPAPAATLAPDLAVRVIHVTSWIEHARTTVPAPIRKVFDVGLAPGKTRVIDAGSPGLRETTARYERIATGKPVRKTTLAARILRVPRPRVVARGVASYAALADMARTSIDGTLRLASSALTMVATAYTAGCAGCSGIAASGRPAGHGIVAVDPRVIALGTRLFIPGYGHAVAGDTGGAIHGNRIDLGFNSVSDAFAFGRREITVYVLR